MPEDAHADRAVRAKNTSPNEAEAIVAMINKSIDASRLQFKRVRKDMDEFHQIESSEASVRVFDGNVGNENMSQSREIRTALFTDVHFLLVSIHETEQLLTRLKKIFPLETDLSNLHNRYRPLMRRCSEFRLHMEHIDGKATEELGRPDRTVFSLRGKSLDLGPAFEKDTEALFTDLVSIWERISERQRRIRDFIVRGRPAA